MNSFRVQANEETPTEKTLRRELMTATQINQAMEKVAVSGALRLDGHFIHHEETEHEFHSQNWFNARALLRDTRIAMEIYPAVVQKLKDSVLEDLDIVVAVATGGVAWAPHIIGNISAHRNRRDPPSYLILNHVGQKQYDLSKDDLLWLEFWRAQYGRAPNTALFDDVIFSSTTMTSNCELLRSHGFNVTSILTVAASDQPLPKLLTNLAFGALVSFPAGETYSKDKCPLCKKRIPKTII